MSRIFPYQVNKAKLIEKIAALVNEKQLTGITDIRDESNKKGIRICIDLKKGEMPDVIINRLYKTTHLQISFGDHLPIHIKWNPKDHEVKKVNSWPSLGIEERLLSRESCMN